MLIPMPMRVTAMAIIESDPLLTRSVVVSDEGNFLAELFVRDGEEVRAGQPLARFENLELSMSLEYALKQLYFMKQQIETLTNSSRTGALANQLIKAQADYRKVQSAIKLLREQQDRLVLRAPVDGTVMKLIPKDQLGNLQPRGTELCSVGDTSKLRAIMMINPADKDLIHENDEAWVRVHGRGYNYWKGHVSSIASAEAKEVPPQLSSKAGGDVATETKGDEKGQKQTERPQSQHFMVTVDLDESDEAIHPGVMGRVKIQLPHRTLAWRFYRYLNSTLNWRL
jgi:multidrug efflux pump subunit AcrA (membrane-fusion protein)